MTVAFVGKALKKRRKVQHGGPSRSATAGRWSIWCSIVDGYMACLSANCASRRPQNPRAGAGPSKARLSPHPPPRARPGVAPGLGRARTGRHRTGGRSLGVTPPVAHPSRGTGLRRGGRVCFHSPPAAGPSARAPPRRLRGDHASPQVRSADRTGDRKGRRSSFMDMDMQFYWGLGLILGFCSALRGRHRRRPGAGQTDRRVARGRPERFAGWHDRDVATALSEPDASGRCPPAPGPMTEPFLDGKLRPGLARPPPGRSRLGRAEPGCDPVLAGRAGAGPRALRLGLLCVRAGAGRARAYGAGPDPAYHAAPAPSGGRSRSATLGPFTQCRRNDALHIRVARVPDASCC